MIKRFKLKGFTMIESLFALVILSIISVNLVFGINYLSKSKNNNIKEVETLNEIENTFEKIRINIHKGKTPLHDISSDYEFKVVELDEMYHIKVVINEQKGEEYEIYIKKKN